jgi:hypothetical protein
MRRRYRVLLLAALVAALVVPVGFALSPGDSLGRPASAHSDPGALVATSEMLVNGAAAITSLVLPLPDGAKLFFIGTALFGLAAVVRKAA